MEQLISTLSHSVSYSIAGATDCPYYAQCERLGTLLSQKLGQVQLIRKRPIDPEEWLSFVKRLCTTYGFRYDADARIDRVIVWNTKTCRLVGTGGADAFVEEVRNKFQIVSDLSWGHMTPIARENKALRVKELEYKSKPIHIIMSGPPKAGKTTQSKQLCAELGLVHISPSELVRQAMKHNEPLAKHFAYYLKYQQQVPDQMLLKLVRDRLTQNDAQSKGWVLDGFPSTAAQLIGLSDLRLDLRAFVLLHISEDLIAQRSQAQTQQNVNNDMNTLAQIDQTILQRSVDYRVNAPIITQAFKDELVVVDGAQAVDSVSAVLLQELAQR